MVPAIKYLKAKLIGMGAPELTLRSFRGWDEDKLLTERQIWAP